MERLVQDLRMALRGLVRDRAFSVTTIATLALCLGTNVAIFAVVDNVLLKPLPYAEPDRLVAIYNQYPGAGVEIADNGVPDYYDRLSAVTALESLAMYDESGITIGNDRGDAERLQGMTVTPSFFDVLRVGAYRGRVFSADDAQVGRDRSIVVTYGYWQRALGGAEQAIGQSLRINGTAMTIVGVLPPTFRFLDPAIQIVRPAAFSAEHRSDDRRHSNDWGQVGRLKPGATVEQVQSQLDALNAANNDRFPHFREILANARFATRATPFLDFVVGDTRRTLALLWGGVLFVLVIGCVNVANLVLVRSSARARELATRHLLGAGLGRLAAASVAESMLTAALGGAAGLAIGWWALAAAPLLGLDALPRGSGIHIDARVVAFTMALVATVGGVMAALPVAGLRRTNLAQVVREEGRTVTATRGSRLLRRALVASQVAFAVVLMVGAGVLVASLRQVLAADPGFRGARVLTGLVNPPAARYGDDTQLRSLVTRVLADVRAMPGVESAGLSSSIPFSGSTSDSVILAEGHRMAPGESLVSPYNVTVTDGYFEAMGARLVAGRWFGAHDVDGSQRVIVIDERLARTFWPGGQAVGKRMYFPGSAKDMLVQPPDDQMLTVVGVIASMRIAGVVDGAGAQRPGAYYFPYEQRPRRNVGLAVKTVGDPAAMADALRRAVLAIDAELPLYNIRTMAERTSEALVTRQTPTLLAGGFAVVALILAAIGLYGVLAYQVSQRRHEIGIRMALGAGGANIFGLVLREGALMVGLGALAGVAGVYAVRRPLEAQLYGVGVLDAGVLLSAGGMLLGVAVLACVVPASRAAASVPLDALRE